MKKEHHNINYIEFSVTDLESAKAFYKSAFAWSFTDYAPVYVGINNPKGEEIGGMSLVESVTTGGPLVVLYSSDLSASLDSVKKAQGLITQDIFDFPGGKRFHFKDPSGNELAVWSED